MKRRGFFIAIALCGFTNAKADQVPKFSQFPAREYSRGPTGRLDLSDPHAYSYRTRLREGAQQGANFAGHYTVVTWDCGTDCADTVFPVSTAIVWLRRRCCSDTSLT